MLSAPSTPSWGFAACLAAAVFVLHAALNPGYGFFRDELYFIVCGRHAAFGYVDQPPLVPLLAAASQLFGTSLAALRAVSAAAAALATFVTAGLVRDIGGGRFAAVLAVLATTTAPVLAIFGTILGPDSAELALWPLLVLTLGRALHRDRRWFLAAGAVAGIAAQAKWSVFLAAAGLGAGILATPDRARLASRAMLAGATLGALIFLPNLVWQAVHGWPMIELLRNGQAGKNVVLGPGTFLVQQVVILGPVAALLALVGLFDCLRRPDWRWLGLGAAFTLAVTVALHGKVYYAAAIYPALFAAGGVALARALPASRLLRAGVVAGFTAICLVPLPLAVPILPEAALLRYQRGLARIGIGIPETEHHRRAALGQTFADMHGWPELAALVARLHHALPANIRAQTYIFAANYGEAAAIDVLAADASLPPVLSGHNQYWLWGPRGWNGVSLLDVNGNLAEDRARCTSAEQLATFSAPFVMPYEDAMPIILCRGLKNSVAALWPRLKHFE